MKRIFLAVVFALFAQVLWMPQTFAQDVWATSYDGKDIYVVTETLEKERIPTGNATSYRGMVKFVHGDALQNMAQYLYKASEDGVFLSIDDGAFFRLGGDFDGVPERYAHYMAVYDTMWKTLRNNRN